MKKILSVMIVFVILSISAYATIVEDGILYSPQSMVIQAESGGIHLIGNESVTLGGYNAPVSYVAKYQNFQGSYGDVVNYHLAVPTLTSNMGMRIGKYSINGIELGSTYVDYIKCGAYMSCSRMTDTITTPNGMERAMTQDGSLQKILIHKNWDVRLCQDHSCYQYIELTNEWGTSQSGKEGMVIIKGGRRYVMPLELAR